MSEYQYYEFQAIDRPLGEADRKALRRLSSRAQITATSFTNHYDYGDFKGDPRQLMARWFDLHLYVANWGTHRFMIRLPKRMVDRNWLDALLMGTDLATVTEAGENLVLDVCDDGEDTEYEDWEDGSDRLSALAPLRADLLSGEREAEPPATTVRAAIAKIPAPEKSALLQRLAEGDPHVAAEVRGRVRRDLSRQIKPHALRTASQLRNRADAIHNARKAARAERRRAVR